MSTNRPLIFITNDDGIEAPGLKNLIDDVRQYGDVIAVAPAGAQSGKSSAITVGEPLRIRQHPDYNGAKMYSVNGTPVDCVKLGMNAIVPRCPDFLFSGINHGSNSGNSVIYSGTMGAVMEGAMAGIASVGFSLTHHSWDADFAASAPWVSLIAGKVIEKGLPKGLCLNVNIPAQCVPKGIKVCSSAPGRWTEEFQRYEDPAGVPFYFLTGRYVVENPEDDTSDMYWLDRRYVTIVPILPDQTAFQAIKATAEMFT